MSRIGFVFVWVFTIVQLEAFAQCENCDLDPDQQPDFCYTDESFEGYCAVFSDAVPSFKLKIEKK